MLVDIEGKEFKVGQLVLKAHLRTANCPTLVKRRVTKIKDGYVWLRKPEPGLRVDQPLRHPERCFILD